MRVLVNSPSRYAITDDGSLWTRSAAGGSYNLWKRYLDVYDEVNILVRTKYHSQPPKGWQKVNGPGIKAVPVPYFIGPWEFATKYLSVRNAVKNAVKNAEAIHLRIPCTVATEVWRLLPSSRPFGGEVIADPYDVFAPGSIKHPLRPIFRWYSPIELRQQCAQATAALYVTNKALQQRYPCPNYTANGVSNVCLPEDAVVSKPRHIDRKTSAWRLVFVGTLSQLYKAPDVLINAISICVKEGLDLKLTIVGDGKHRAELEAQAAHLDLGKHIYFHGQVGSSDAVREHLDKADLFILPSYQEGLPRAMIEAMARGLPCIGSTAGGIPELLPPEDMVTPGDAMALAEKIREVITNTERMTLMSARNLETAKQYKDEVLQKRRIAFYNYIRESTQVWLKQKKLIMVS